MIRILFHYVQQPLFQANRGIHTSLRSNAELMVNGKMLHYEVVGKGDKVSLCLPGALGTIQSDFGPQLTGLSHEKFKLVAWDPPGYGKSRPPPRKYDLNFLNRDCDLAASLMKNLGYSKYSLLGWSDGGITAMMIAAAYPERVEKMVIWGANAYIHEGDLKMYEAIRDIEKWSPRMRAPLEATYGKEYFKAAWEGWVDAFTAIYRERDGDLCKSDLAKITCPSLIVHGAKDPMVGQDHADYIHRNIANSQAGGYNLHLVANDSCDVSLVTSPVVYSSDWLLVMEEGKHNLHLRYADEFNAIVTQFLLKDE